VDEHRKSGADGAGDTLSGALRSGLRRLRHARRSRLPRHLRSRLEANADAWIRGAVPDEAPAKVDDPVNIRPASRAAWYVAAACLAVAILAAWPRVQQVGHDVLHGISPLQADVERDRLRLIDSAGARLGRWPVVHESGLPADVAGEVVWDGKAQQGYVTLSGLEPNAHANQQYQLWIFDAARDDRYPVNGGVFDVPAGAAHVTVPVRPTLFVARPVAFAVTLEQAGGVVVSDRRRLMALARASTP